MNTPIITIDTENGDTVTIQETTVEITDSNGTYKGENEICLSLSYTTNDDVEECNIFINRKEAFKIAMQLLYLSNSIEISK